MVTNPLISHLSCDGCGRTFEPGPARTTCPACGDLDGTLTVHYRAAAARDALLAELARAELGADPRGIWRYGPVLPVEEAPPFTHPVVGPTPLSRVEALAAGDGVVPWLKDDGRNPSGSLKDRASVVGVADAVRRGAATLVAASTGNAASSVSLFCACAGLPAVLLVPRDAPAPKVAQLLLFGARVLAVRGTYDQAFDLSLEAARAFGWYSRSTAVNPVLGEGKKTVSLELFEQLGRRAPDAVVVSVGDGCIVGAVVKGFMELREMGLIDDLPRVYGVQAAGAAPLVAAFEAGEEQATAVEPRTFADSIAVGRPRDGRKALRHVRASGGGMVAVSDGAIRRAMRDLARRGGVFAEPAGATGYAGFAALAEAGELRADETVAVLVTGSGLKDVDGARRAADRAPEPVEPDLQALRALVASG